MRESPAECGRVGNYVILTDILKSWIKKGVFLSEPKLPALTPIFKSVECTPKKDYRPISILNSVSKLLKSLTSTELFFRQKDKQPLML